MQERKIFHYKGYCLLLTETQNFDYSVSAEILKLVCLPPVVK
jgi:hypothetical protein